MSDVISKIKLISISHLLDPKKMMPKDSFPLLEIHNLTHVRRCYLPQSRKFPLKNSPLKSKKELKKEEKVSLPFVPNSNRILHACNLQQTNSYICFSLLFFILKLRTFIFLAHKNLITLIRSHLTKELRERHSRHLSHHNMILISFGIDRTLINYTKIKTYKLSSIFFVIIINISF